MKKNTMMRLASALLVLVLLTTCAISGTFAKYTSSANSEDFARVAYWGWTPETMNLTGLFADVYSTDVDSVDQKDVIAPGTAGSTTFTFAWDETTKASPAYGQAAAVVAVTGPEVAYTFDISIVENCDDLIKDNLNIKWYLDDATKANPMRWDDLIAAIEALEVNATPVDGKADNYYAPNTLPAGFTSEDDIHTIAWEWVFEGTETYEVGGKTMTQDEYDTYMGNAAELDDVYIKITITATQVDA